MQEENTETNNERKKNAYTLSFPGVGEPEPQTASVLASRGNEPTYEWKQLGEKRIAQEEQIHYMDGLNTGISFGKIHILSNSHL